MVGGGAHNTRGEYFQQLWSESELDVNPHISLLETRAAREAVFHLALRGDKVRIYIDNTTACSYIKRQGGT